ncbi:MAG: hypothetical protein ACT4PE_09575 [Candidatus Eiseniibacteriota bacterium]
MSIRQSSTEPAVTAATLCAFAMVAHQVAGKATRDALFLSTFDITLLPRMVMGSALFTIAAVLASTRLLPALGPSRLVPAGFAVSALALVGIRFLADDARPTAAVLLYLHVTVFGAVSISWFWSLVSERFDPRTARKRIGRIAGGATLGGLCGGIVVGRIAPTIGAPAVILLLAGLHLACAAVAAFLAGPERSREGDGEQEHAGGAAILSRMPYLRHLAWLVLAAAIGTGLLDYVFKVRARSSFADSESLLRFFALYYTGVAALTFVLQSTLTRRLLGTVGLAKTASAHPLVILAGGAAAAFAPGLPVAAGARGAEAAVRSSLFRSSYELFFAPLSPSEKRASKTLIDVGFDRLGDAVGAACVQVALALGLLGGDPGRLGAFAAALGVTGLLVTRRLERGHVAALERNLVRRGGEQADVTAVIEAMPDVDLTTTLPRIDIEPAQPSPAASTALAAPRASVSDLHSNDSGRVRSALRSQETLAPQSLPRVIELLAWDEVAPEAAAKLRSAGDAAVDSLVAALLDPETEFAVRRRIPRVLVTAPSERTMRGLLGGLFDQRFEVRYQCGAALARLRERRPDLAVDAATVLQAVKREARVERRVWESHRLLDAEGERLESPFVDDVIRERSHRGLAHVFALLSLVLPAGPLKIAYRGLHTDDAHLRGTALEYLESVLSEDIRESLWPFLDDARPKRTPRRADEALDSLLQSHESIQARLEELRRRPDAT